MRFIHFCINLAQIIIHRGFVKSSLMLMFAETDEICKQAPKVPGSRPVFTYHWREHPLCKLTPKASTSVRNARSVHGSAPASVNSAVKCTGLLNPPARFHTDRFSRV